MDATTDDDAVSPPSPETDVAAQRRLRRNARDRSRSQLKKRAMEEMRREVAQLEAAKRQLQAQVPSLPTPDGPPTHPPLATDALRVLQQIERLRRENRAMALEVLQRDLFRSAVQNLLEAPTTTTDGPTNDGSANDAPADAPPIPPTSAAAMARRIARRIATARRACEGPMQRVSGARVFGWSDFRFRTDASVQFTIQKALPRENAQSLARRTWHLFTDTSQLRCLLPAGVACELRVLQRVADDAIVVDRITTSRSFERLPYSALRTTYMLVRACDDRGHWSIGMKTVDLPVFRAALAPHESWCDVFYWFHFEDVATIGDGSVGSGPGTAVMFGGALSYYNERIAREWLAELVFLAVRWESKVVAPVLLKN